MWKYDSDRFEWAMELPKGTLPHYPHNDSVIYAEFSYGSALVKLSNAHDGGITLAVFDDLPTRDFFRDLGSDEVVRQRVERAIRDTLNMPAWYMFTMERDYDSDSEENLKARFGAIATSVLKSGMPAFQLTPALQLRFETYEHSRTPQKIRPCLFKNGKPVKSNTPKTNGGIYIEALFELHTNKATMASILEFIVANIEVLKQTFITEYTLNYEC